MAAPGQRSASWRYSGSAITASPTQDGAMTRMFRMNVYRSSPACANDARIGLIKTRLMQQNVSAKLQALIPPARESAHPVPASKKRRPGMTAAKGGEPVKVRLRHTFLAARAPAALRRVGSPDQWWPFDFAHQLVAGAAVRTEGFAAVLHDGQEHARCWFQDTISGIGQCRAGCRR